LCLMMILFYYSGWKNAEMLFEFRNKCMLCFLIYTITHRIMHVIEQLIG